MLSHPVGRVDEALRPSFGAARPGRHAPYHGARNAMDMSDLAQPVCFDRDLVRKYDRPGPRYTSYPTAPQFRPDFGSGQYAELLARSRRDPLPLSLYVHVPFCVQRCFFCGCNVVTTRNRERGRGYLEMLEREMRMAAGALGAGEREVVQVHWGGGTPTFLPAADLSALMGAIRSHFRLAQGCEIGVEIDPRECSDEQLAALVEAGCNRLSLGVQDLDPRVQRAINRVQPPETTWRIVTEARRLGVPSINVDLIYGLPHQTRQGFAATVEEILRLAPDRLAVFNFAYLPAMFRHQRVIDPAALPGAATKLAILEDTVAALTAAGYVFLGMDHFARPDDSLAEALRQGTMTRNFQGYSTHADTDLVAFGVSSIGKVADGYAQNARTIPELQQALDAGRFATCRGLALSAEDRLRREAILGIMCRFRLDKAPLAERFGIDFDRHFAAELAALAPLAEDGLVELHADRLQVTGRGRFLVRNVAMAFDAYLPGESAARYSRTV